MVSIFIKGMQIYIICTNTPISESEQLFHFAHKQILPAPAYLQLYAVCHDHNATIPFLVFLYMLQIDKEGFVNAQKMGS